MTVYQSPRNPTPHERRILTLLAEGRTHKQAAARLGIKPHSLTAAVEKMRERYTAPTNVALVALAVRLQWIALAIDCAGSETL
ncbi:MAG TPA: LuxR C-terminal-related transcriptional regulator [Candidatus Sulfotelmatobacter sp.]|nr:LuxR C-terminal-related transcriptional regulator [Candidatus Sulfotelmatobacter sp.]